MGNLISMEAAIEAIVSLTAFESEDELKKFVEEKVCDDYYLGGLCDAIDEIKDTTAVDVAPVVHGRCVSKSEEGVYGPTYCSICDFELRIDDTPYCPMCGARMDGDTDG